MESRRAAFRVGLFVIGGIAVLLGLLFFLSGAVLHPGTPLETYFSESVQGLDIGTSVKFRGVTIGKITDIGLVSAEYPPGGDSSVSERKVYQQVVVRFTIDPRKTGDDVNLGSAIKHGLRVQIAPQGITGLAYLELTFVSPAQYPAQTVPWVPDSPVIPSIPSTLTQVQDAVQQVISSLGKVDLGKMVDQVSTLVAVLNQELSTGNAHKALANANALLVNLNDQVTQSNLPATTQAVRTLADGPRTQQILAQLSQTTAQLNKVSAELPALVAASQATISQASETTADLQSQLIPILQDMKATTANLRALTSSLQRNPSAALLGAPPPPEDK
jgi:ABC-type transporter Mla subunit MlaD